jgi:hypothetical protein
MGKSPLTSKSHGSATFETLRVNYDGNSFNESTPVPPVGDGRPLGHQEHLRFFVSLSSAGKFIYDAIYNL